MRSRSLPERPEFQKFLDHTGIVQNFLTGSLAHLRLARAYVVSGGTAKAKTAYLEHSGKMLTLTSLS